MSHAEPRPPGPRPAMPVADDASNAAYEKALAQAVGAGHAVAFSYARHALIGILEALNAMAGDEVVLAPLTCKVVALALLSLRLRPVYADIDGNTLNLDAKRLDAAIGPRARFVLFQHTYGHGGGIDTVAEVARHRGLVLIEDCAQCLPLVDRGYAPGRRGRAAIFSANLGKPLPAGSGGAAVTDDPELAQRITALRDRLPRQSTAAGVYLRAMRFAHRRLLVPSLYWPLFDLYRSTSATYRVRPVAEEIDDEIARQAGQVTGVQARAGLASLQGVRLLAAHRRGCGEEYERALRELRGLGLIAGAAEEPLYYFPVLVSRKRALLQEARRRRIEAVAWPLHAPIYPLERTEDLGQYGYVPGSCPVAEDVAARLVGLPTRREATPGHRRRVVDLLIRHAAGGGALAA